MAMLPYVEKEMEMKKLTGMMAGKLHTTASRGFGDLSISGLYKLSERENLKVGISIPTGEFNEKITTRRCFKNITISDANWFWNV